MPGIRGVRRRRHSCRSRPGDCRAHQLPEPIPCSHSSSNWSIRIRHPTGGRRPRSDRVPVPVFPSGPALAGSRGRADRGGVGPRDRLPVLHRHAGRLAEPCRPRNVRPRQCADAWRHGGPGRARVPAHWFRCSRCLSSRRCSPTIRCWSALAVPPPPAGTEPRLLPGRVRGPGAAEGDADGAALRETVCRCFDGIVYVSVYFVGTVRLMAQMDCWLVRPAGCVARGYVALLMWFVPPPERDRREAGRRAVADDRPHRRQLHQHPDGEALRPSTREDGLCPRRDGRVHAGSSTPRRG